VLLLTLRPWQAARHCAASHRREKSARHRLRTAAPSPQAWPRPRRRGALALAAGAIFRAKGGIALAAAADGAAGTLLALAPSSPPGVHLWLLHGLWLLARAAGLGFMPHVRPALDLALAVLLAEGSASVPGLRPAAGRRAASSASLMPHIWKYHSTQSIRHRAEEKLGEVLAWAGPPCPWRALGDRPAHSNRCGRAV